MDENDIRSGIHLGGSFRRRFQMTEQIRLCLPARWDGIRSLTALRIRHHDEQGHARGRSSISGKKTTGRSEIKFFLSERPVVGHSRELASPAHPISKAASST
jgi:hypothetical protein